MALPFLTPFALAAACLLGAAVLTILTLALIQVLSKAPVLGGWIADKATVFEAHVSHALGVAFGGIDHFIAGAIHHMARYIDEVVAEIKSHARLLAEVAATLVPLAHAVRAVYNLAHGLAKVWQGIEHGVKQLTRVWHGIEHRVHQLERDLTKGIGHDLRLHVKALEQDLDRLRHRVIPSIRSDVATADAAIDNLYEWAKGKASLLGIGTFATAVAAAIGLEVWKLLRCPSFGNIGGKRGCGLWNDLESILGLLADTVLLTNICTLLPTLETAVSDIADPLVLALTDVGAGLCVGGIGAPPALAVPQLHLPVSPGITLSLP